MVSNKLSSVVASHWLFGELILHKSSLIKALILNIFVYVFQIFVSIFAMVVYNKVLPNHAISSLLTLIIGISVILAFDIIFKILKSRLLGEAVDKIDEELQRRLFAKILAWDLQSKPKLSGASSTLLRDVESVSELFANSSITTLVGIPFVFINSFVIYLIAGPLALVTASVALFAVCLSLYFYFRVMSISEAAKQSSIDKNSVYLEALNNLETLKSVANYSYFTDRFNSSDEVQRSFGKSLKYILADANSLNATLSAISQISLVSIGALLVINGVVDPGALFGAVILNGKTLQPVMQLAGLLQKYSVAKVSYKKLGQTFDFESEEEKRRQNISVSKLNGPIVLNNVMFQPPALQTPIMSASNLKIKDGESIGIIGSVGSGKSTLLKLLSGILAPTSGTICYGAYDTTAINQTDLRSKVAYLGQSPGVFAGSIRDNLTIGNSSIDDDKIAASMKVTGFDEILKKFPNGLSYQLSENGSELSGGQKQILALTRSVLIEPDFIILDEPTSAMDPRHENLFIRHMKGFIENRTFIVVTHRKPILGLTNRLLVVENGKIVLDGNRDEVLQRFK